MQDLLAVTKRTLNEFVDDDCMTLAASLAYYTVFSLAPLLLIVVAVMGLLMETQAVQERVQAELTGLMGPEAAEQVSTMMQNAAQNTGASTIAGIVGLITLIFAATTAFAQLQAALNRAWEVEPDPKHGGLRNFITKRVMSFGMILGVGFLLLVSLVLSAVLAAMGLWLERMMPGWFSAMMLQVLNQLISLGVITLLFAAIFKILPDAQIEWGHVWPGAFFTAVLFTLGKLGIGLYLGNTGVASAYGAAGSLAVILIWVYYSSIILLLGAEFTQVWVEHKTGRKPPPEPGAQRVERRVVNIVKESQPPEPA
jgi:membrane protein